SHPSLTPSRHYAQCPHLIIAIFLCDRSADLRDIHSFPTRRSSDLRWVNIHKKIAHLSTANRSLSAILQLPRISHTIEWNVSHMPDQLSNCSILLAIHVEVVHFLNM